MSQWRSRSVIALAASAVYVYGFPAANLPYVLIDLFHVAVGVFLAVLLLPFLVSMLRTGHRPRASDGRCWPWERSSGSF